MRRRCAFTVGDTFAILSGCDKTAATCATNFANIENFRGFGKRAV